ncbi:MAG: RnfABCDGE type electron transport complex subunit D [Bacteroidota bacterium]
MNTSAIGPVAMPLWRQVIFALQRDARHFQIFYLSMFLVYGIFFLGWDGHLDRIGLTIGTCLGVQAAFIWRHKRRWTGLKSALISSLGLCLLLKTNGLETIAIAGLLTIASKFFVRIDGKHIFNPVNFGLIVTILLTGDAWVSPGQWGSSAIAVYFMGAAALLVLLKVGRIDTSLAFLLTYLGLEFGRTVLYLGWPVDHWLHMATNGTVLLFTFFMITDPMTTPNARKARVYWSVLVAVLTFVLAHAFHLQSSAPIWALFIISPLTIAFDKLFVQRKYEWAT